MTKEVVDKTPQFLPKILLPAKLEIRTPGGSFVTPEGPFKKENKILLTIGLGTLRDLNLIPKPRDEFVVSGVRFRILAWDKDKFLQNNQSSLDKRYTCEYAERKENADLPDNPQVEVDRNG